MNELIQAAPTIGVGAVLCIMVLVVGQRMMSKIIDISHKERQLSADIVEKIMSRNLEDRKIYEERLVRLVEHNRDVIEKNYEAAEKNATALFELTYWLKQNNGH